MAGASFAELVSHLLEAVGQRLDAAKPIPEGLLLRTNDNFLYAFVEDPGLLSMESVERLMREAGEPASHLVVLTPGRLPLALEALLRAHRATVVDGQRFLELARQLDLESYLGESPRAEVPAHRGRLLPSAQQLDQIMTRARTWLDWGVPALALRFYRQAAALKPEYIPAKTGIGRSLLALGLVDDADKIFEEILKVRRSDVEARLGKAAVLGVRGRTGLEIDIYRSLLAEDHRRVEVRTHLMAALISQNEWRAARTEIETMLQPHPEDPSLRFLHSVALERTGATRQGAEEREAARRLGLSYEREVTLCTHLGIDPPAAPPPPVPPPLPPETEVEVAVVAPVIVETVAPPAPRAPKSRASGRSGSVHRRRTKSAPAPPPPARKRK
jgi:tetratricopeptide (TPR) repeat protein